MFLRNEGYHVLEAVDGQEALNAIQTTSVQLIILDVMMPRMDGIMTCLKWFIWHSAEYSYIERRF